MRKCFMPLVVVMFAVVSIFPLLAASLAGVTLPDTEQVGVLSRLGQECDASGNKNGGLFSRGCQRHHQGRRTQADRHEVRARRQQEPNG